MILSYDQSESFLKVYSALMYYAYSDFEDIDVKEFIESGFEKRLIARRHIFKNRNIIDEFIQDYNQANKERLATNELDLLAEIKNGIFRDFIVLNKNNEVYYIDYDKNIYKIAGIKDEPIELYQYYPCLIRTAILNYGNRIISDGLIEVKKLKYDSKASKRIFHDFENDIEVCLRSRIEKQD